MVDDGYGCMQTLPYILMLQSYQTITHFSNQSLDTKIKGARDDVVVDSKNNPSDFYVGFTKEFIKPCNEEWEALGNWVSLVGI